MIHPLSATAADSGPASVPGGPVTATGRLVRRAVRGDQGAFERLVRHHERRVFGLAWRLLGNPSDAEDAGQEAFLRLYRALGSIDPDRPLAPYLDRITVNVCRDLGRARSRRRETPLEPEPDGPVATVLDPADPRPDPAADTGLAELRRLAAAALGTLPFKQRAALVLRELHGLSTREVAAALGSSETSVRSHVCRARLALRERLAALRGEDSRARREEES